MLAKRQKDLDVKKKKYLDAPEKKGQAVKKRYSNKKNPQENQTSNISYKKASIRLILKCSCWYNKYKYQENPGARIKYQIQKVPGIFWQIIKKGGTKRILKPKKNIEKIGIWIIKKKRYSKIENFLQQVKQGTYYICTICHPSHYHRSVRLFKPEKCHILTADLYHPVKSFHDFMKNFIFVKHVISIFIKTKFHIK